MTKTTSNQNVNIPQSRQQQQQQLRPPGSSDSDIGVAVHGNTTNSTIWDTIQNKNTTTTSNTSSSSKSNTSSIHSTILPSIIVSSLRFTLSITIILYILNQQHLLPKNLSSIVSSTLFWPTLPITLSKRIGKWYTIVDDTVIMGGAPFNFMKLPNKLYHQYKVRGVINLCEEYRGPIRTYQQLGIRQLYLPTTDHFEPSVHDIQSAIQFIIEHEQRKEKVYIHCRAGHGRSAAITLAWLVLKHPNRTLQQLNYDLCQIRNVRKTLYQQPNLLQFHELLLLQQSKQNNNNSDDMNIDVDVDDDDDDDDDDNDRSDTNYDRNQDDVDNDEDDESQLYSFNNNIEDEL